MMGNLSHLHADKIPAAPEPLAINVENIPAALKDRPQWLVWKYEWAAKRSEWTKVPYRADGHGKAKSTDSATWSPFAATVEAYQRGGYSGIGFALSQDDPFTIVDLDKCLDEPWATGIIRELCSYTEVTPSGNGYHVVVKAAWPDDKWSCTSKDFHGSRVEVYAAGRYMTFTGQRVESVPQDIHQRQDELEAVCAPLARAKKKAPAAKRVTAPALDDDAELLRTMFRVCKGSEALYNGSGDDASGADLGLCNHLAFMTGHDAARMDRLFRDSGLMRGKWDEIHRADGTTYGQMTVEEAIDGTGNAYDPSRGQDSPAPAEPQPLSVEESSEPESERPGAFPIPESCRESFIVKMGMDMARVTEMPEATAVMTALGAFSGIASMSFATGYSDGQRLPLGLYIVGEQPPATAKSRLLNSFVTPWLKALRKYNAHAVEEAEQASEDGEKVKPKTLVYPFANATPEAMEQAMTEAGTGHFWLQSAEQGAIRMLFGDGVKDRPKNFDLALKGFNGEFHASARVTRSKLEREVYGAITVLAQAGSIRTILANSDGDGLAERFMFVAEPHNLGSRKHEYPTPCESLREGFMRAISATVEHLKAIPDSERGELDGLKYVGLSADAHRMIRDHKRRIEPKLAHHADNGDMAMTAMLGKSDIQAMKLAAVMYLSDCLSSGKPYLATVPDEYLTAALELVEANLAHIEKVLVSMDKMGPEAAREVIRRQFDRKDKRTVRDILQNVKKVKPFKDNAKPNQYARRVIDGMINRGDLVHDPIGKTLQLG